MVRSFLMHAGTRLRESQGIEYIVSNQGKRALERCGFPSCYGSVVVLTQWLREGVVVDGEKVRCSSEELFTLETRAGLDVIDVI